MWHWFSLSILSYTHVCTSFLLPLLSGRDMKIIDGDSSEAVERFPVSMINQPTAFNHQNHIYDNILIFTVQHPEETTGKKRLHSPSLSLSLSPSLGMCWDELSSPPLLRSHFLSLNTAFICVLGEVANYTSLSPIHSETWIFTESTFTLLNVSSFSLTLSLSPSPSRLVSSRTLSTGELHIFQCNSHSAQQVVDDLNHWMKRNGNISGTTEANVNVKETVHVFNAIAAQRETYVWWKK